jgi:hypothetical protein
VWRRAALAASISVAMTCFPGPKKCGPSLPRRMARKLATEVCSVDGGSEIRVASHVPENRSIKCRSPQMKSQLAAATWAISTRACAIFFSYMRMEAAISSRFRPNVVTVRISGMEVSCYSVGPLRWGGPVAWTLKPRPEHHPATRPGLLIKWHSNSETISRTNGKPDQISKTSNS